MTIDTDRLLDNHGAEPKRWHKLDKEDLPPAGELLLLVRPVTDQVLFVYWQDGEWIDEDRNTRMWSPSDVWRQLPDDMPDQLQLINKVNQRLLEENDRTADYLDGWVPFSDRWPDDPGIMWLTVLNKQTQQREVRVLEFAIEHNRYGYFRDRNNVPLALADYELIAWCTMPQKPGPYGG